ncbi:hypothetical protein C9374_006205 [Naegleria lovaniensis]|uniref:Uncharacterized protein n=1 Tax=Naegleria lovaniensis TaxID=51637 RepID=A0AA88GMD0_NAELO|nr:uncharacterized protein C9374_006205 [Naegleria lovaniensis]KAG2381821.1 hypothetical protein C9374_006205 [Naegleria lovaniensis]
MKRVGIKPKPSFRTDNEHKVDRSHDSINSKLGEEQNTSLKTLSNDRKAEDSENGFHSGIEKDSEAMDRKLKKFLDDDDLMNSYLREEQISSSQSRSRKKISPAILELLEAKKRILTTLWEDSETNWAHRETFMHSHFNDDAHKNFEQISKETMRVFEIRWLDLRIKGLIEQRENSLRSLRNICEKNSLHPKETGYIDCKIFEKLLGDEIVLFRTISLYIIEYIETWKSKQTETDRDVYLFEDNDYILKMATDLKPLVERFSQLFNYLEEKDLNFQSPLFLPKNPRMYFKYYGQRLDKDALDNSDFEENQSIYSKGTSGTLDDGSSFFLTSVKKSSDDFSDEEEEMEIRPTRDTATNRSMRSATSQNTINMLIALNQEIARKAPQTGSFGKVQHFNEETTLLEEDAADLDDDENRLVYNRVMSADKQSDISQPTDLLEQIQVQMQLPPLLVNQAYSDRTKRHKKYTEPLISIRHEDLLEQLERRNPLHYKDLMEKDLIEFSSDLQNNTQEHLSSKKDKELLRSLLSESESNTMDMIQTLDEQTKVHNIDLASTKKVLLKKDKLIQKFKQQEEKNQLNEMYEKMMEEQRAAKAKLEILRKRHIASTYASHSKSQPSITNAPRLKFAPPDPVREMRRLALAEKHIASMRELQALTTIIFNKFALIL